MPTAIILDLQAARQRAIRPLVLPRLTAHLVAAWAHYIFLPVHVAAAAIDGYAEAHRGVLRIVE